ncbi:kinase-like domain-containing protein, partial [Mycena rebaudengoi]
LFRRRVHRLLNILADFLKILPKELAIHGIVLLSDHPVKYGGFADIYHGQYTDSKGETFEVALKKFAKEALVWHYLNHPNIVPFLGVDATTFPSPTMAMVSSWMSQGNVLNYMGENSPLNSSRQLNDVTQGLMYLHSENIVHGDLCGRNILMYGRQACLTDFGLASFIESDTSYKTSARSESTHWMAPELLLPSVYQPGIPFRRTPASDVWTFGCVCCEIWTEGQIPFDYMSDGGLIIAFSAADPTVVPYQKKPCDKAGSPMPELLWELVHSCFKLSASERPAVNVITDTLSEMNLAKWADTGKFIGFMPRGSGTTQIRSPGSEVHLTPTPSPVATVVDGRGKQRDHFEEEHPTVRFGPLPMDGASEVEELFYGILDGLIKLIRRDVLIRPFGVEKQDSQYVHLQFRSLVEANNFAMTWMVYCYEPYKGVSAVLVDN